MEMNTRLQVEHPVTEMITGLDLVEWQLRVAAGHNLDFTQESVEMKGHSIEARIYAEDPQHGFVPSGGRVLKFMEPSGEGIRVDSALIEGLDVTSDYDPMMAKVISWGPDRETALRRLQGALRETVTLGVVNNVEFLMLLLANESVMDGRLDTGLIERQFDGLPFRGLSDSILAVAALILHVTAYHNRGDRSWEIPSGWRVGAAMPSIFRFSTKEIGVTNSISVCGDPVNASVAVDGGPAIRASARIQDSSAFVVLDGVMTTSYFALDGDRMYLANDGAAWTLEDVRFDRPVSALIGLALELKSPMPGSVSAVLAEDGQIVDADTPVICIEAMKMEHVLRATRRGTVSLIVGVGTQVRAGELVATIEPLVAESEGDSAP
jgi:acetyl-CoA/propionyl-CoA carboxylase biotin carboxyl carrier protein